MPYLIAAKDLLDFVSRTNPMIIPRIQRATAGKEREYLAAG